MTIGAGLRNLNLRQLFRLSGAFILRPRYLLPTFKATKETVSVCNKFFGRQHHGNNRTNAFRHAFWNYKICERCLKLTGSPEKSVAWAKKITDLHEELLPSDTLSNQMDLHNNEVGRNLFRKYSETNFDVVPIFMKMMNNAEKISDVRELKNLKNRLVFTETEE